MKFLILVLMALTFVSCGDDFNLEAECRENPKLDICVAHRTGQSQYANAEEKPTLSAEVKSNIILTDRTFETQEHNRQTNITAVNNIDYSCEAETFAKRIFNFRFDGDSLVLNWHDSKTSMIMEEKYIREGSSGQGLIGKWTLKLTKDNGWFETQLTITSTTLTYRTNCHYNNRPVSL